MQKRFRFGKQERSKATEGRAGMSGKGYSIVFSSRTGNTAELAEAVREALPEGTCEYFGDVNGAVGGGFDSDGNRDHSECSIANGNNKRGFDGSDGGDYAGAGCGRTDSATPASETLFVGFWTNQGVADQAAQKLLEQLRGRKIFLFGTAGFGGSEAYFQAILDKTKALIGDSNTVNRDLYMPGQNAAFRARALRENEGTTQSHAQHRRHDRELRQSPIPSRRR